MEMGLSTNTLAAHRADLRACAGWLSLRRCGMTLLQAAPLTCRAHLAARHAVAAQPRAAAVNAAANFTATSWAPRPYRRRPDRRIETEAPAAGCRARCRRPKSRRCWRRRMPAPRSAARSRHARTVVRDRPARQRSWSRLVAIRSTARRCCASAAGNKEWLVPIGRDCARLAGALSRRGLSGAARHAAYRGAVRDLARRIDDAGRTSGI